MKLSENFGRHEFACKCGCGFDTVDAALVAVLENLRGKLMGKPVLINSGCRCPAHNARVKGSPKSMHLRGKAADIRVVGMDAETVADCLEDLYPEDLGIGRAKGFVHVDVRGVKARFAY